MEFRGGYKIINLGMTPIKVSTATKAVVDGIYERIESSFKPILLEGIVINDTVNVEFPPAWIYPAVSSGDFVFNLYGYAITVTDDDEIYYTVSQD